MNCYYKKLMILSLLPVLLGCVAYRSSTAFYILNSTTETITVRTTEGTDPEEISFDLAPGAMRTIHTEKTKCPENYVPVDRYDLDEIIPPSGMLSHLEIWIGETRLNGDALQRINWDFWATDYTAKYTLIVDERLMRVYSAE